MTTPPTAVATRVKASLVSAAGPLACCAGQTSTKPVADSRSDKDAAPTARLPAATARSQNIRGLQGTVEVTSHEHQVPSLANHRECLLQRIVSREEPHSFLRNHSGIHSQAGAAPAPSCGPAHPQKPALAVLGIHPDILTSKVPAK